MSSAAPRRTQGAVRYAFLIVLVLVLAAAGVIFWKLRSQAAVESPAPVADTAVGPVIREGAGIEELLQRAHEAMAAQRLVTPAGNNAFELYLAVLKHEPGNQSAQDALREIFPFAAHAAEQTIDEGNGDEAQREIELLARADPQNYTLTLLRSKLQALREAAEQQAQAATRRETSGGRSLSVASAAAVAPVAANKPATVPVAEPAARPRADAPVAEAPRPPRAPEAASVTPPMLAHRVEPVYPPEAKRTRRQGWVDVTFTVQPDGSVSGLSVADADPRYVFDRAALAAVSRWQFNPGLQDGKPVAAQVRQRIEFRL